MGLNAIHIHTDFKFLHNTKMFEGEYFSNTCIYVGAKEDITTDSEDILFYGRHKNDFSAIVELCSTADLVVLYDLDFFKMRLAMALPDYVKIAWRFFGYELYSKRPDLFKSELTKKYDRSSSNFRRKYLSPLKQILIHRSTENQFLKKSINRINFFLALSDEEYTFLKSIWPNLPILVRLPHYHLSDSLEDICFQDKMTSPPLLIIGNSRTSYNNHLDIFKIIEKYSSKYQYRFSLLFSYGTKRSYAMEVLKRVRNKSYFDVVENYMNKDEFSAYYKSASALVINGYRQMAGANIRAAFQCGVKVYMNNKNIHKKFLQNHGFIIFSMNDFEEDLKANSLSFDQEVALHNFDNFKKFREEYSIEDFQRSFMTLLCS